MEVFLDLLKEELSGQNSIPILKQADKYRVRESAKNYQKVSQKVVDSTAEKIQETISEDVKGIESKPVNEQEPEPLVKLNKSYFKKFPLNISNIDYMVHIELSYDETIDELIQVGNHLVTEKDDNYQNIGVRLSLIHPFMIEFAGDDHKIIEPVLRFAVALGLSEIIAKKSGAPITEVRNNLNELLKMADIENINVLSSSSNNDNWNPEYGEETEKLLSKFFGNDIEAKEKVKEETYHIMQLCGNPERETNEDTGLVFGYVQSGKTLSFTTLTALARDNNYQIVIILAGISTNLVNQSYSRLLNDLNINKGGIQRKRHLLRSEKVFIK